MNFHPESNTEYCSVGMPKKQPVPERKTTKQQFLPDTQACTVKSAGKRMVSEQDQKVRVTEKSSKSQYQ